MIVLPSNMYYPFHAQLCYILKVAIRQEEDFFFYVDRHHKLTEKFIEKFLFPLVGTLISIFALRHLDMKELYI